VCLEVVALKTLGCNHQFCSSCVNKITSKGIFLCPFCRKTQRLQLSEKQVKMSMRRFRNVEMMQAISLN